MDVARVCCACADVLHVASDDGWADAATILGTSVGVVQRA
jgi:hypothetical protein